MNPLISVIVPIYNVEKYLARCVDSIVNQTYKNLEIILVDDGSPDRCPQMCDDYAEKDSRIKVVHKKNGGLSDARNAGMAVATGEYISFIDSDDWIETSMFELLINNIFQYDCEISCGGIILKIQRLKYKRIVFMWNIFDLRHKIRIYLWPIIIFMLLVMETIAGTVGIKKKIILMQSG